MNHLKPVHAANQQRPLTLAVHVQGLNGTTSAEVT